MRGSNECPECGGLLCIYSGPGLMVCSKCPARWSYDVETCKRGERIADQTIYDMAALHAHLTVPPDGEVWDD